METPDFQHRRWIQRDLCYVYMQTLKCLITGFFISSCMDVADAVLMLLHL